MKKFAVLTVALLMLAAVLTACSSGPDYNKFSKEFATTLLTPATYKENAETLYKSDALKNFFASDAHEASIVEILKTYGDRFTAMASPVVEIKSIETQNAAKEKDGQYKLDIVMKYTVKEGDKTTDLIDTISAVMKEDAGNLKIVSLTGTKLGIEEMNLEKENQ